MRVYVIRHGESQTNLSKQWTGWMDVPLTEKGKQDAQKAGQLLRGVEFDKVYSSDLCRAMKTAENAIPGCSYETTPLLREINVGTLAGMPLSTITPEQRARVPQLGYSEFNGETMEEFQSRVAGFMEKLESLDCETVAAFTHAGFLRGMLDAVVGTYLPRANVCCENCTVAIFQYAGGVWKLHSWINLM